MKTKKIISLIAISVMAIIPFKVSAADSCTTKTNYYLFHADLSQWDDEVTAICGDSRANLDACLVANPNATVSYPETTETAYFENNIPSAAKIITMEYHTLTPGGNEDDVTTINGYHEVWKTMLNKGNFIYKMTDVNDSNINYFLHTSWTNGSSDTLENRPFFTINTNFASNSDEIMADIRNAYLIGNQNKKINNESSIRRNISNGDAQLILKIQRSYNVPLSTFKNGTNACNYTTCDEGTTSYHLIHPSVYEIKYEIGDCTQEYTITYHSNDGKNQTDTDTANSGDSYQIKNSMFTRSGYDFIGWSTDKDATQGNPTYSVGKTISVDGNLDLYAVWVSTSGQKGNTDQSKTGIGYSLGIIGAILAATGGGIVYFKKRNKFENI